MQAFAEQDGACEMRRQVLKEKAKNEELSQKLQILSLRLADVEEAQETYTATTVRQIAELKDELKRKDTETKRIIRAAAEYFGVDIANTADLQFELEKTLGPKKLRKEVEVLRGHLKNKEELALLAKELTRKYEALKLTEASQRSQIRDLEAASKMYNKELIQRIGQRLSDSEKQVEVLSGKLSGMEVELARTKREKEALQASVDELSRVDLPFDLPSELRIELYETLNGLQRPLVHKAVLETVVRYYNDEIDRKDEFIKDVNLKVTGSYSADINASIFWERLKARTHPTPPRDLEAKKSRIRALKDRVASLEIELETSKHSRTLPEPPHSTSDAVLDSLRQQSAEHKELIAQLREQLQH